MGCMNSWREKRGMCTEYYIRQRYCHWQAEHVYDCRGNVVRGGVLPASVSKAIN